MKKIINYILALFILGVVFISCEEQDTMRYDKDRATINFNRFGGDYIHAYSFLKTDRTVDTIDVEFYINGFESDTDRNPTIEIVADSTTASDSQYEILNAIVPADSIWGTLTVKVNKVPGDDTQIFFRIEDGDDFTIGYEYAREFKIVLSNKLTPAITFYPGSSISKYKLGTYSTAYYKFIIDQTGETEFPIYQTVPGYNNGERWPWFVGNAFVDNLKFLLSQYNESIAPDVLTHDDGNAAGKPVVVGLYYN